MNPADIVANILEKAASTFRSKRTVYGDNWITVGYVLVELFPEGVKLKSVADFTRMFVLMMIVMKTTRYARNFGNGHRDSIRDITVYSAMLEAYDTETFDHEDEVNEK